MRIALILLLFLGSVLVPKLVVAADLGVRVNDHQGGVRVVLEWPAPAMPTHQVRVVDERTVEVRFDGVAELAAFQPSTSAPEVVDVRRVSEPGQNLKLWIMLGDALYRRDLQVGKRLIIDLNQSSSLRAQAAREAQATKAAPAPAPVATPTPTSSPEKTATPKVEPAPAVVAPIPEKQPEVVVTPAPTQAPPPAAMPTPVIIEQAPPAASIKRAPIVIDPADPPVLTFASTAAFGTAAFVSHRTLWVVIDDPDFIGTPKLSGKQVNQLPPLERSTTKDATLFRMQLPNEIKQVRGEGGDLLWRVVFAPPKNDVKPLPLERRDVKEQRQAVIAVKQATKVIEMTDPTSGEQHWAVTVRKSNEYMGPARRFAEFVMPQAAIGIAVTPLVDDLSVTTSDDAIVIARPQGMSMTSALDAQAYKPAILETPPSASETEKTVAAEVKPDVTQTIQQLSEATGKEGTPLFRFDRWAMGGQSALLDNETALVADLAEKSLTDRAGGLMNIGKMYLANDRGSEAVGYFRIAADVQPALTETPEFLALRGAAYALNSQFDLAYEDLRGPALDVYPDVNLWRAYTLANLQDWQQASVRMGKDLSWARQYPDGIARPMILTFAEIALRAGKAKDAASILAQIDPGGGAVDDKAVATSPMVAPIIAQYEYLQGETARQLGKKEEARKLWSELVKGKDDKFRARARLAMAVLDYEEGKIKPAQAIDQLESLRFAWRGDEVEAAINARLGEIYLDHGDYLRGLNALKEAAGLAPDTDMGRRVTATMADEFRALFVGDKMKKVDPLDAITVYEKFSELVPAGNEANRLSLSLVDRLMEVDLLDRAAKVLQDLIDHRLQGDQRVEAALRLAATHLLNRQPQLAIATLNRAGEMLAGVSSPETLAKRKRELALLRARAQFQAGQIDSALSTLGGQDEDVDVLRARADIAWQTGRWGEASTALERLLALAPVAENKPPTREQAEFIRNLAVATNLSGDRGGLSQLRSKYNQTMMQSEMSGEFDVITRERQTPTLADRDTMNRLVAEVDLFGSFLNSYRQTAKQDDAAIAAEGKAGAPAVADPIAPTPAPATTPATEPQAVEAD